RRGRGLRVRNANDFLRLARDQVAQADRAVGAADVEAASAVLDVRERGFERLGGELPALEDEFPGGGNDRRSADEGRAGADATNPVRAIGIALHDGDLLRIKAKDFGDELRIGR